MHLAVLVISQRILLQTLVYDFIGDYHLIGTVGLNHKFQNIEQFAGITARETKYGCGLSQFDITFL